MPESPEELYRRSADALRTPPVGEWDSWPFEGEARPRALRPPEPEPVITGAGGVDCPACEKSDAEYLWTDERWRLRTLPEPAGGSSGARPAWASSAAPSRRSGTRSCRRPRATSGT